MVHSVSGWTRCVQVKLWDPLRTRAIPERLRGAFTTRRYTNSRLPCLTLPLVLHCSLKSDGCNSCPCYRPNPCWLLRSRKDAAWLLWRRSNFDLVLATDVCQCHKRLDLRISWYVLTSGLDKSLVVVLLAVVIALVDGSIFRYCNCFFTRVSILRRICCTCYCYWLFWMQNSSFSFLLPHC